MTTKGKRTTADVKANKFWAILEFNMWQNTREDSVTWRESYSEFEICPAVLIILRFSRSTVQLTDMTLRSVASFPVSFASAEHLKTTLSDPALVAGLRQYRVPKNAFVRQMCVYVRLYRSHACRSQGRRLCVYRVYVLMLACRRMLRKQCVTRIVYVRFYHVCQTAFFGCTPEALVLLAFLYREQHRHLDKTRLEWIHHSFCKIKTALQ